MKTKVSIIGLDKTTTHGLMKELLLCLFEEGGSIPFEYIMGKKIIVDGELEAIKNYVKNVSENCSTHFDSFVFEQMG